MCFDIFAVLNRAINNFADCWTAATEQDCTTTDAANYICFALDAI